jgi:hypothetical protein
MRDLEKRQERIRAVAREYKAAKTAVELFGREMQLKPALGQARGWGTRDAKQVQENLEPTFIIRLYAEFEAGLREAWEHYFKRATRPSMNDLLFSIASSWSAAKCLDKARAVKDYRNNLVHEGDPRKMQPIPFEEAQRSLATFLSRLPPHWRP